MKKSGSTCEFSADRTAAIMAAYRSIASRRRHIDVACISAEVVAMPAPRFWVSEERATAVLSAIRRCLDPTSGMIETKRRMYREISRRVDALQPLRPGASLYQLVCEVVNQPAPEFYMSPRYAGDIIYRTLNSLKTPRIDR